MIYYKYDQSNIVKAENVREDIVQNVRADVRTIFSDVLPNV